MVRGDVLDRVHIGLDFFDASMNRVGAWVIGSRAMIKALLIALLEPQEMLRDYEENKDYFARLALLEGLKTMPFSAVWDYHCLRMDVPVRHAYIEEIKRYEREVTGKRLG
jgi:L-rhamnose isomerase